MNSCVNCKATVPIYLIVSCGVASIVLSHQPASDHFQPFLEALSLNIMPTIFDTSQATVESTKRTQQLRKTDDISPTFAHISPSTSKELLHLSKLALYKNKKQKQPSIDGTLPTIESNATELKFSLKFLSSERFGDPNNKEKQEARRYIFNTFKSFGLNAVRQTFKAPYIDHHGVNLIGIRPGSVRLIKTQESKEQQTPVKDRILVIGAHYDTVENTTGLNDNGSGIGVMLEIIRMLDYFQCETNYTVIFVAFDLEELGAIGSKYFVHEYLIPNELSNQKHENQFQGAIIMDTLLNFDPLPGTQDIPNDIHQSVPEFSENIKFSNYSGDFLAMFARTNKDLRISKLIEQKWKSHDSISHKRVANETHWNRFKLKPVYIQTLGRDKEATFGDLQRHVNMLRSDHLHFWYHNHSTYSESLSAVLLTDTGPFRGYMRYCYHKMCDDGRFLSKENVNFARKTAEVLVQVVLQIAEGKCLFGGTA